jgi:ribosomal protein S18 acetylase RimI-like enzyme
MSKSTKAGITIRSYKPSDAEAVRFVCVGTLEEPLKKQGMEKLILTAFCEYYIKHEPYNCFVAADENGRAIGYILCAEDADRWLAQFRKDNSETLPQVKQFLEGTCTAPARYSSTYPAHLHIDILPEYQRVGLGTRLMDALVNHLKSKGIPGLMLSVSSDNEKGIRFYDKYGFKVLEQTETETVMGIKLEAQAYNPYLPGWEYIPDGEPYVFGDRVYIYGSHDKFNGEKFCMNDYVCWSAPVKNLSAWRYEGVIFKKTDDPAFPDGDHCLYAPDVQLGLDGRYYLYYAFDNTGVISVAVCDTPAGEYQYLGSVHTTDGHVIGSMDGDIYQFDPGVFIDDDGRVFLYSGFSPKFDFISPEIKAYLENLKADGKELPSSSWGSKKLEGAYVMELEPDMLTVKRGPELMIRGCMAGTEPGFEGHEFFEASSMRKINGSYYFIYSSVNGHELCYAVSDRPDGGFKYGGTIVSIGDVFLNGRAPEDALNYLGNTHGSLVEIEGQWYVFYHRQTNRHQYSRQACAEPVIINADGSINQVEITSCGLNGSPLAGKGEYPARIACNLMAKDVQAFSHNRSQFSKEPQCDVTYPYFTQDGDDREDNDNQYIANMRDGAIAGFKYFEFKDSEAVSITIRGTGTGKIIISTELLGSYSKSDLQLGKTVSEIIISPSAEWKEYSSLLSITGSVFPLYFMYEGDGAIDFISFTLE